MEKIVVAHFAQQHSLQTAVAIDKIGRLDKYITTLYDKNHNLLSFFKLLLKGNDVSKIGKKRDDRLKEGNVIQFCEAHALLLKGINRLSHIPGFKGLQLLVRESLIYIFDSKVGNYVVKNRSDAVILYDTYALQSIKIIKSKSPSTKIIIDMSAPYIGEINEILTRQFNTYKYQDLRRELADKLYNNCLIRGKQEIERADYFFVASEFSKTSLIKHGIDENRIFVCPYGKHETYGIKKSSHSKREGFLNCIFVGNVNSKKGIQCFLEVAKRLAKPGYSFCVIGDVDKSSLFFQNGKEYVEFKGILTHEQTISEIAKSDILIFPTLADGYGFVITEALSMGVPVFASSNAGASDLIANGENGYVFDINDSEFIIEHLELVRRDEELYQKMSRSAIDSTKDITWESYQNRIANSIYKIFESK